MEEKIYAALGIERRPDASLESIEGGGDAAEPSGESPAVPSGEPPAAPEPEERAA
jgi:hypothetical protein